MDDRANVTTEPMPVEPAPTEPTEPDKAPSEPEPDNRSLRSLPAHAILSTDESSRVSGFGAARLLKALASGALRGAYVGGRKGWRVIYGALADWVGSGAPELPEPKPAPTGGDVVKLRAVADRVAGEAVVALAPQPAEDGARLAHVDLSPASEVVDDGDVDESLRALTGAAPTTVVHREEMNSGRVLGVAVSSSDAGLGGEAAPAQGTIGVARPRAAKMAAAAEALLKEAASTAVIARAAEGPSESADSPGSVEDAALLASLRIAVGPTD